MIQDFQSGLLYFEGLVQYYCNFLYTRNVSEDTDAPAKYIDYVFIKGP